jgi:hypothetical protein
VWTRFFSAIFVCTAPIETFCGTNLLNVIICLFCMDSVLETFSKAHSPRVCPQKFSVEKFRTTAGGPHLERAAFGLNLSITVSRSCYLPCLPHVSFCRAGGRSFLLGRRSELSSRGGLLRSTVLLRYGRIFVQHQVRLIHNQVANSQHFGRLRSAQDSYALTIPLVVVKNTTQPFHMSSGPQKSEI